ncbi:hypothetical protein D210916BOD24_03230 [Alteromonas sp. D210916BOD_24]
MGLFLLILVLSISRLNDVKHVLNNVTSSSIPTLTHASSITRDVQRLTSLTARLTGAENHSSRRIVKNLLDETIVRLNATDLQQNKSQHYLLTQLSVLAEEIEELEDLVSLRIDIDKEVSAERDVLFRYLNSIFDEESSTQLSLHSAQTLVPLILQIAQINQQYQLHELRKLEVNIEKSITHLKESAGHQKGMGDITEYLAHRLLGPQGMIEKQANVMRIQGRLRGRGSFVEHLAQDVAANIEFSASTVTQNTSYHAVSASERVSKQISWLIILSTVAMLFCCAIIFYIYKRIIKRLVALTSLVENASDEVATFEGNDEISRLAKTFALYFQRVQSQEAELIQLSLSDPLTGISNRRAFNLEVGKSIAVAKRYSWPLSLLLLDVDSFKAYNDNYGHTQGDVCLKSVAATLSEVMTRNTDFCARYGGEEFVAILANTDETGASIKAEKVRAAIEALQLPHSKSAASAYVTVSVGVATFYFDKHSTWDLTTMLNVADEALYEAKSQGRNRCVKTVNGKKIT